MWNIVGYLAMLAAGVALTWATRVGIAIVALWAPSVELEVVYDAVWQFARYPITIYGQPLRFALSWVIPLAFISTVPARALTSGIGVTMFLTATVVGVTAGSSGARRLDAWTRALPVSKRSFCAC